MTTMQQPRRCSPRIQCGGCGKTLPLRPPGHGQVSTSWICTECGALCDAVLDAPKSLESLQRVRPARIKFDKKNLGNPPQSIAAFIVKMLGKEFSGDEKRSTRRHNIVFPVPVVELDEAFCPTGDVRMAVTRDISTTGLALISTRAASARFLAVELTCPSGETIQVVIRVIRCRPVRCFYEIAGTYFVVLGEAAKGDAERIAQLPGIKEIL
ncbi:MAG: PilZ domain-containing protein [Planctomycetes bacterium]|nr:PilZ domain-containing protein [Planctomycetota bacterium]